MYRVALIVILVIASALRSSPAAAQDVDLAPGAHVRSLVPMMRSVLAEGVRRSSQLRSLVARLNASDVVVYLDCLNRLSPPSLIVGGEIAFIASAGGRRYLMGRIDCGAGRVGRISLLAHELQHAVEIAEATQVVDPESMQRHYMRIGFEVGAGFGKRRRWDTRAANDVGGQARREASMAPRSGPSSIVTAMMADALRDQQ